MGGFEALEEEMKLTGKGAVDLIVRDCLQTSPSRFLFVEFVHLVLSAVIYARHEMRGSGGMVFVAITAMAGPTGSFALLAAHHEFQTLRARKLI